MTESVDFSQIFQPELIKRYDQSGPRYTSYPTAVQFTTEIGEADYAGWAAQSNQEPIPKSLSLYFHIPFCNTVCFYCACNKIITANRKRAAPYLDHLHKEIEMQATLFDDDRVVEQLHWGGGTPTFLNQVEMAGLMAHTRRHFKLRDDDEGEYSIELDPREIDANGIRFLRDLGFNRISLGVQDIDSEVQKAVNRIQPLDITLEVLRAARDNDYRSVSMDLIYGLPKQRLDSFSRTLDIIIDAAPDRLSIFNYAHLPHLFKPQRQIDAAELPSPAEKLAILEMCFDKLGAAGYVYIGMDHFAKPDDELAEAQRNGQLHRNFQGYSTRADCDLIGLGMTSIGKVLGNYSQNHRKMDDYVTAIDNGHLPIFRGYELEPDDLLRREIINGLICHFELDTKSLGQRWNIDFHTFFKSEIARLQAMQDDGLLRIERDRITVLPPGRLLIRNICMVFDRYLDPEKTNGRFSKAI